MTTKIIKIIVSSRDKKEIDIKEALIIFVRVIYNIPEVF